MTLNSQEFLLLKFRGIRIQTDSASTFDKKKTPDLASFEKASSLLQMNLAWIPIMLVI
jgi:hypothetical protein